jgi:predicted DNA-binding transcriptional regulator AlpA
MDVIDLIDLQEASRLAHLPVSTLRFYRHKGQGPHSFKVGRRVMFHRADVEKWIRAQEEVAETTRGGAA